MLTHSDYCGNFQHGSENEASPAPKDRFYRYPAVKTRNNHISQQRHRQASKMRVHRTGEAWNELGVPFFATRTAL
jgi:hypothetical protein